MYLVNEAAFQFYDCQNISLEILCFAISAALVAQNDTMLSLLCQVYRQTAVVGVNNLFLPIVEKEIQPNRCTVNFLIIAASNLAILKDWHIGVV